MPLLIAATKTILDNGNFDRFIGEKEGSEFEVKGATPYDFSTPHGRYELAKDVSAFANAGGGYLLVGLREEREAEERAGVVKSLELMSREQFGTSQIEGLIKTHVWPAIQGLEISWYGSASDRTSGLGAICIPPQAEERKWFLITKMSDEGEAQAEIVVGIARRQGSDNVPFTSQQIYEAIRKGRDGVLQRTSRIEEKLDAVLRRSSGSEPVTAVPKKILGERINNILND